VELVIALQYRTSLPSLRYFWAVLDLRGRGEVGEEEIRIFYQQIFDIWQNIARNNPEGYIPPPLNDVMIEILDLAKSSTGSFTFQQLVESGNAEIVITILTDAIGFWRHDNREALAQALEDDEMW